MNDKIQNIKFTKALSCCCEDYEDCEHHVSLRTEEYLMKVSYDKKNPTYFLGYISPFMEEGKYLDLSLYVDFSLSEFIKLNPNIDLVVYGVCSFLMEDFAFNLDGSDEIEVEIIDFKLLSDSI